MEFVYFVSMADCAVQYLSDLRKCDSVTSLRVCQLQSYLHIKFDCLYARSKPIMVYVIYIINRTQ